MSDAIVLPEEIALFPIRGCILLPGQHLPLNVFEPRYLNMIDDAMSSDKFIGMIQTTDQGTPTLPALERVGTVGRIASHSETDDGRYLIVLEGIIRFTMREERNRVKPYRVASVDYSDFEDDLDPQSLTDTAFRDRFLSTLRRFFDTAGLDADWDSLDQVPLSAVVDKVAMAAPFDPMTKQSLLSAQTSIQRADRLHAYMEAACDAGGEA
jgi:Lon protease-like protein